MSISDKRRERLATFLESEHFRYRRFGPVEPAADEWRLPSRCSLRVDAPPTPLMEQAVADFTTFCQTCMQVELRPGHDGPGICLRLTGGGAERPGPLDPAGESFVIEVGPAGVEVTAPYERGLLHATHMLERLMADRGAPCLPIGRHDYAPRFMPRISLGSVPPTPAYLALMSHFGANGVRFGVHLDAICPSRVIPELDAPGSAGRLRDLNARIAQLGRHGIDAYLCVSTSLLPPDHPAFRRDPTLAGAPYRVFDDMPLRHVLCTSHPDVQAYHAETVEALFRAVPEAAGAVFIIGGEGLMHCYTRPLGPFKGYSSCPRCQDREPAAAVAGFVNLVGAAVKRANPRGVAFAWPYSAFTWSGADRAQLRWIEGLSRDVEVLGNFDTNSSDERNGAGVVLYDYNIKSVGPSAVFREQARQTAKLGRRIFAKTESNATPSVHFLPYIPVHFRWRQRFREMADIGVAGYMGQWGFYGMNASLPEEMQVHAIWNPDTPDEALLTRAARRDFGLDAAAAGQVVEAWRTLSGAWDDFPYSAMTNGEREFYCRGPLHYGPAHPLIFNIQNRYNLPAAFFGLSGDLWAMSTPEERERLMREAKPRYVSELLMTLPYGVARYLELTTRCRQQWADGVAALKQALGPKPTERARMELDVCELIDIHLAAIEHTVRFHAAREHLWQTAVDVPAFKETMEHLKEVLRAEIANAERSLPILERDFRVRPYDADMVRAKIRQCRYVLEDELPIFDVTVRFHVWNDYP